MAGECAWGPGNVWKKPQRRHPAGVDADQTKKMDGIFQQSRIQLIDLKQPGEARGGCSSRFSADSVRLRQAMLQIDKVRDARADSRRPTPRC